MQNFKKSFLILLFLCCIDVNAIECPIESSNQLNKDNFITQNKLLLPENHKITHLVEGEKEFFIMGYKPEIRPQIFAATLPKPFSPTDFQPKYYKQTAQNWFWPLKVTPVHDVEKNNDSYLICGWQSEKFGSKRKQWLVSFQNQQFDEQWQNKLKFLSDGLMAYYPFNGNAKDASGNGNDGTVHGAILTKDRLGNRDSAYSFDGVDNKIEIPDTSNILAPSTLTISVWAKSTKDKNYETMILYKGKYNPYPNMAYSIEISEDKFIFRNDAIDSKNIEATSVDLNKWYHLVGVFDKVTKQKRFYVNGKLLGESSFSGKINQKVEPLCIGGYSYHNKYAFHGIIDNIRIYNHALSDSEIQLLYQLEKSGLINQLTQTTPRSCNHALALGINNGNGIYQIDPDDDGKIQPFKVYCDMENNGLTFYLIEGGIKTGKVNDQDSCQERGLKLFAPRTKQDYEAARKYLVSIKKPKAFGPLGVYHPKRNSTHIDGWTSKIPMNSANAGARFGWKSTAGDTWWISDKTNITEPNGDYHRNGWLAITYDELGHVSWYNDCCTSYHSPSYTTYLCMSEN